MNLERATLSFSRDFRKLFIRRSQKINLKVKRAELADFGILLQSSG